MREALHRDRLTDRRLAIVNAAGLAVCLGANVYFQVFCVPVAWAIAVLAVCFPATVGYAHWHRSGRWLGLAGFVGGVSFCVFVYCAAFIGKAAVIGLALLLALGLGLFVFTPHILAVQLLMRSAVRPPSPRTRAGFFLGVALCLGIAAWGLFAFREARAGIEAYRAGRVERLSPSYMTERILGMHFIYHVRICLDDGWRPPKHDPLLNLALALSGGEDPLPVTLPERLALYRATFPERPVKFACACAIQEAHTYHGHPLWPR